MFILTLSALCFCACDSNKGIVEELANQFISAVNAKDKASIYSIYPNAKNLSNMTLPESIQTGNLSVEKNDSNYVVTIENARQQKLVFKVIGESQIEMVESYSILDLDSAAMELAIKTGVPMKQIPDLAISKLMDIGGDYIEHLNTLYSGALKGGLIREGGTFEAQRAYGGNVSVAQPIRNVGNVPIKGSEYNVEFTFYCPNGTASGRLKKVEEGIDLEPNEAATIYVFPGSGYVNACFEHDFAWIVSFVYKNLSPIDTLLKYVKFTGKEYDEFLKDGKQKSESIELILNLKGTLGGSNDAVFNYDGKKDSGELTFTVNGNTNKRLLKMGSYDETNGHLVMTEFYQNGEKVGEFDGTWEKGSYQGVFTNTKGNSIDFKLSSM